MQELRKLWSEEDGVRFAHSEEIKVNSEKVKGLRRQLKWQMASGKWQMSELRWHYKLRRPVVFIKTLNCSDSLSLLFTCGKKEG